MESDLLARIWQAVAQGQHQVAPRVVEQALGLGVPPGLILSEALLKAMDQLGEEFSRGIVFVPELLVAARAMKACLRVLAPLLTEESSPSRGTCVLGTVEGDLHDIGKTLVGIMLEGSGFRVIDLGVDVAAHTFVEAVEAHRPQLLGLSCLLSTTMPAMDRTLRALEAHRVRDRVKVMVGGAVVTPEFCARIGADGYAPDAGGAARLARELVGS